MKTENSSKQTQGHLPPHPISEALKNEMENENKQPPSPNSFLDRLPTKNIGRRE